MQISLSSKFSAKENHGQFELLRNFAEIFTTLCLSLVSTTPVMKTLQQYQLAYTTK